jgi:cytoskeletal protein CcmA (bactofilin family)
MIDYRRALQLTHQMRSSVMNSADDEHVKRVSLFGPSSDLKGDFIADGELVILGRVVGNRLQATEVTVGPKARVEADIHAQSIRIEGVVVGDIHAKVSVIVQSSATVRGAIHCPSITIREGASVNGSANLDVGKEHVASDTGKRSRQVTAARRA